MSYRFLSFAVMSMAAPAYAQQSEDGLPTNARAWYLDAPDGAGELFVYEIGVRNAGAPVVVLHGGPGGELTYILPVARGLASEFHFVFYDQRGSLRSRVATDSITMAKHVADLEHLRKALGVERLRLLSHSAGTLLALEYLRAFPDRVTEIVLTGALPHKNGTAYFDDEYRALWEANIGALEAFGQRVVVAEQLALVEADTTLTPERRTAARRQVQQFSADLYHIERWAEQIPVRINYTAAVRTRESTNFEYDFGPDLARHGHRVTVLNGNHDYVVGPEGSPLWKRLQASVAPNIHVVVLPEAGHQPWVDQPELFESALRRALTP